MICSCRTAALRIFVRNISQLHVSESNATAGAWRSCNQRLSVLEATLSNSRTTRLWSRDFHNTIFRSSAAEAVAASTPINDQSLADGEPSSKPSSVAEDFPDFLASEVHRLEIEGSRDTSEAAQLSDPILEDTAVPSKRGRMGTGEEATASEPQDRGEAPKNVKTPSAEKRGKEGQPNIRQKRSSQDMSDDAPRPKKEPWQIQKDILKKKFPEGWRPRKRLSPDALEGIRALNAQFPDEYTTEALAEKFEVSPEAMRRILKSKWQPNSEEEEERQERWFNRGKQVWSRWAELGKKPPRRWRQEGIARAQRGRPGWRGDRQGPDGEQEMQQRRRNAGSRISRMGHQRKVAKDFV
ncbi:hypothetical protein NKR23_g7618 [Pleurostoma richardsiae]|uniref:Required for respiratory growth protein 9, mitochondrial n=1 Tax=Pleurostoma richardsiae TaxID=41990 RepID=A0AA38RLB7_9PEZI|nr:hypothetical protein NKR23_g7618 [Pleurostoma richardsiae]